jgi:hypothetical protein
VSQVSLLYLTALSKATDDRAEGKGLMGFKVEAEKV